MNTDNDTRYVPPIAEDLQQVRYIEDEIHLLNRRVSEAYERKNKLLKRMKSEMGSPFTYDGFKYTIEGDAIIKERVW